MPRGRQYYDPEIQVSRPVEAPKDLSRIEFYPELDGSGQIGRWVGRRIHSDGTIIGYTSGNFDHDAELAHAQELWPGLEVFELPDERSDSTWEGTGPSPRIWQTAESEHQGAVLESSEPGLDTYRLPNDDIRHVFTEPFGEVITPVLDEQQMPLHVVVAAKAGTYVLLDDIRTLLESWAVAYETDKNPSAAMALRDAVDALKDIG